jgi:DNA-directed RNA polymerase subunit RPC12/RpoP
MTESFDKSCAYCGARFRVLAAHGPFGDHAEEYACPECGKRYETQAAHGPRVELLQARSDGKEDRYQDTMF